LRNIHRQFPQPPEEVLNINVVDAFLEDPDFNEEKLVIWLCLEGTKVI
jgi:hypothetical protein